MLEGIINFLTDNAIKIGALAIGGMAATAATNVAIDKIKKHKEASEEELFEEEVDVVDPTAPATLVVDKDGNVINHVQFVQEDADGITRPVKFSNAEDATIPVPVA